MVNYLNFEKPLSVIEGKIRELNELSHQGDGSKSSIEEINKLEVKAQETLESLYKDLNTWEKTQVARHPERPHFLDYSRGLVEDFTQLSGDRVFGEDSAIIGGIGKLVSPFVLANVIDTFARNVWIPSVTFFAITSPQPSWFAGFVNTGT